MKHFNLLTQLISGVFFCTISSPSALAQKQEENKELQLNKDAVKMIQFDFNTQMDLNNEPKEAPLNKKWMEFKTNIGIPRSLLDTAKVKKPKGYIRMLPYTIWTRFGEDPVYDVLVFQRKKELEMTFGIEATIYKEEYGKNLRPAPGKSYASAQASGAGAVIQGLDINKFLTDNLTRRGRMLRRNRKHAIAWKTYSEYQPTKADTLKVLTFYRRLPLTNSEDSIAKTPKDSISSKPQQNDSTSKAPSNNQSWYQYIQQKVKEDSIQKQNPSRKKAIKQNAYDIDRQLKRLKELQN